MRIPWVPVLTLALVAGCSTMTMRISRAELQSDLAKRFPVEADKHVVVLTASDPRIDMPGNNALAVRLRLDAVSATGGSHLSGTTRVQGRIEYVAAEHAFYVRDPKVTELVLHPPEGDGWISRATDRARDAIGTRLIERAARSAVEELLRRRPVYRLDARRGPKEAKAIRHLRSVRVEGDDLVLVVGL